MRIAIATDNGYVSPHFGRCSSFIIATVENGKVLDKVIVENPGHQPGFIPQFLLEKGVDCIIAGGIGTRAKTLCEDYGILIIGGVGGTGDEVIQQFIAGTLEAGQSICSPGAGKGYGLDKEECDHHEGNHK